MYMAGYFYMHNCKEVTWGNLKGGEKNGIEYRAQVYRNGKVRKEVYG